MSDKIDLLIKQLGGEGRINKFMRDYVEKICLKNMDDEMCHEAVKDAIDASSYGVANDNDFKVYFYINHFVDLEVEEIIGEVPPADLSDLKRFMFGKRNEVDYSNLSTYRAVALMWSKERAPVKLSYMNTGGPPFVYNKYNLDRWKVIAHEINKLVALGKDMPEAMTTMVKNINPTERDDFKAWYKFNFGDNRRLYNINDKIKDVNRRASMTDNKLLKVASIFEDGVGYWAVDIPKPKPLIIDDESVPSVADSLVREQKASDINDVKTKMINRTFAIDKLLEKYRNVLSEDQTDQIEDSLNILRKTIRKLKLAASIKDSMIKTAGVLNGYNFSEGANVLLKLAAPPEDAPEAPKEQGKDSPTKGVPDKETARERSIDELKKEDLKPILDKLYDVSVRLKRRNIVREIASIDLDLYGLNIASFFPELTDAQAKLIEAFGYASNKIEDVIPKLRSVSTEPPAEYESAGDEVTQQLGNVKPEKVDAPEKAAPPAPKPTPTEAPAPTAPPANPQVK